MGNHATALLKDGQMKRHSKITIKITAAALILTVLLSFASCGIVDRLKSRFTEQASDGETCEVYFIDVGQGDSELIIAGDKAALIDAGPGTAEDTLIAYLGQHVRTIDYLILTHPHEDHIGGADKVIKQFEVSNVILTNKTSDSKAYEKLMDALEGSTANVMLAAPGEQYSLGSAVLTILAPLGDNYDEVNDFSIVTRLDACGHSLLFTGDAQSESESEMLRTYDGGELDCDVLKVGHHGSATSTADSFLGVVSPEYAVISCGDGNEYGHPDAKTEKRLNDFGVTCFRTDLDGTVMMRLSDGGITTETLG